MNIVDQKHWDESYKDWEYYIADNETTAFMDTWIQKSSEITTISSCFEIGCYPGSYLTHIAKRYNLVISGVDLTPEMGDRFFEWLNSEKINVGDFYCGDAFEIIEKLKLQYKKYDMVYSCGFIEHFDEYLKVIERHGDILKQHGILIITTPNFSGAFQKIMHILVDGENYKRHVIEAMNPQKWRYMMEKEGYKTLFCGYYGIFDFWVDNQKRNIIQEIILRIIIRLINPLKRILRHDRKAFSPYCGLVMVKE